MNETESVVPEVAVRAQLGLPWLPANFDVLRSFDAEHWAAAFLQVLRENPDIRVDHDPMRTWFANALMRGYDEKTWRSKEYKRQIRRALIPWWKRLFVPLKNFGR